jgi:choline dehydrogenase-like flavoprotein
MIEGLEFGERPDVCVVGAGPAGLTIASKLGAAGQRVVLLESGGFRSSAFAQELNDGDLEGEPYAGLQSTRHRQVGGTPNTWNVAVRGRAGAKYAPLSPSDLTDWPIDWQDLAPFYAEAQELCGLGPFRYGADDWTTHRPFPLEGTGLTSGIYQFGYADRFTRWAVERMRGSETITVVPSATVVGLALSRGGARSNAVRVVRHDGRMLELEARTVILACGAVENARLLLLESRGDSRPSPWLGRCFMEHARDFSLLLVPDSPGLFAAASFYDLHHSKSGVLIGGRLGLTDEARQHFQLPNAAMTLVPRPRAGRPQGLTDSLFRLLGRTRQRYGWSRTRSPASVFDAFEIVLNLEQRPQESNRIELSRRSDRFGNPLPRLVLHWTDREQAGLEQLRERIGEWFRDAKLGRLRIVQGRRPDLNAHHHAGTTRMAGHAGEGVVDSDGRLFGCENVYVAGASVFPSAGYANPTLTIVALALRLAAHLGAASPRLAATTET